MLCIFFTLTQTLQLTYISNVKSKSIKAELMFLNTDLRFSLEKVTLKT